MKKNNISIKNEFKNLFATFLSQCIIESKNYNLINVQKINFDLKLLDINFIIEKISKNDVFIKSHFCKNKIKEIKRILESIKTNNDKNIWNKIINISDLLDEIYVFNIQRGYQWEI